MVTPAGDLSLNPNVITPGDISRNFNMGPSNTHTPGDVSRNVNYYHEEEKGKYTFQDDDTGSPI